MFLINELSSLFEKLGLATSWIRTFETPFVLFKYFNALNVDCCLVFPPRTILIFLRFRDLTRFESFLL